MATKTTTPPLHTHRLLRRATFNHFFISIYAIALLSFFYHHLQPLLYHPSSTTTHTFLLLLADLTLAFWWFCTQSFHLRPIRRHEFPENLPNFIQTQENNEYPALDIFICTADPYKEPPIGTVNTALSVMAYDYPQDKISIYVSDDGGAQATIFAFIEGAKFAKHWLPFVKENNVVERSPEVYFNSSFYDTSSPEAHNLKTMYESMKVRIENVVERGKVEEEYIDNEEMQHAFAKWTDEFTRHDHPTVIQVVLDATKDKDISGKMMPNLIYVSREKSKTHHHRFKAGALNALIRISATMTNAPIVLTLDCDSISNDPQSVKRALCYFLDHETKPTLAYVQFPQIFNGLNKGDIYFSEHKRLYQIYPLGMDGLSGPNYLGTGCFFQRRAFFGGPSNLIQPETPELSPDFVVKKPIGSPDILKLAHSVSTCNYENGTSWGVKLGMRYGSMSEDFHTGYRMQCEGWRSMFCYPERPAFFCDSPVTLNDLLSQCKRWSYGLIGVILSRYSTLIFGVKHMGLIMSCTYSHHALWPILCIPLVIYAFVPQLALLQGVSTFPKISDPWCLLYIFLFIGAYAKDLLDFILEKGTFERWWNSQRMWMICGLSSFLFGSIEYILTSLGIAVRGFNVTSKLQDDEVKKRYDQGIFEFGVDSPMFALITMAAIINLVSFVMGSIGVFTRGIENTEGLILQILLSGFGVINCWPIYEAMVIRSDNGRMPTKITLIATFLASVACLLVSGQSIAYNS